MENISETIEQRRHRALEMMAGTAGSRETFLTTAMEALTLGMNCMLGAVGELSADKKQINLLSLIKHGKFIDPYVYDLLGTPCADVYKITDKNPHIFITADLCDAFPEDDALRKIGAVSYRAEVFHDASGQPTGHVFVIDDKEARNDPGDESFFRLVAQRVGAEFNRWRAERA